jgi:predicted phage baseplate assembly protein
MLSGIPARGVKNPRGAEGGADGETVDGVRTRGPQVLRHRRQALSAADYEALAREASPGVAIARALPTTSATGLPRAGRVRLIIVPQSLDPQPQPSFELRRRVRDFLMARTPATLGGLTVAGPEYLPVGVEAAVTPRGRDDAGSVRDAVEAALAEFLHPLRGGPDASGWPFGRNVYLSDVAALLEGISGVDHVNTMSLLLDGTPRGEVVEVPPDRIVTAGRLQVTLAANEV